MWRGALTVACLNRLDNFRKLHIACPRRCVLFQIRVTFGTHDCLAQLLLVRTRCMLMCSFELGSAELRGRPMVIQILALGTLSSGSDARKEVQWTHETDVRRDESLFKVLEWCRGEASRI